MKATELRDMNESGLREKLADLKEELFNLRFQHAINQLENPNRLKEVKQDIARVKTVIRELELHTLYYGETAEEAEEPAKAKRSRSKKVADKTETAEADEETGDAEVAEETKKEPAKKSGKAKAAKVKEPEAEQETEETEAEADEDAADAEEA